jgi:Kazal-type serine protease inhibitor domain
MHRVVASGFAALLCTVAASAAAETGSAPLIRVQAQTPEVCTQIWLPVCGTDREGKRVTYSNAFLARVANATNVTPGECSR